MIGLAKRMNEMTGNEAQSAGAGFRWVSLRRFASVSRIDAAVAGSGATIDANGVFWPSRTRSTVMALQSEFNSACSKSSANCAGSAMITLPSSLKDFDNPDMRATLTLHALGLNRRAESRMALLRIAVGFLGSEFGSRHQQYEKFYGGASFLVKQNVYRNFDFAGATKLVDAALNLH